MLYFLAIGAEFHQPLISFTYYLYRKLTGPCRYIYFTIPTRTVEMGWIRCSNSWNYQGRSAQLSFTIKRVFYYLIFYLNLLLLSYFLCKNNRTVYLLAISTVLPLRFCLYFADSLEQFSQIFMASALFLLYSVFLSATAFFWLVPSTIVWTAPSEALPVMIREKCCLACLKEETGLLLLTMVLATWATSSISAYLSFISYLLTLVIQSGSWCFSVIMFGHIMGFTV